MHLRPLIDRESTSSAITALSIPMKLYVLYMFVVAASAATDSESEAADRWSRLRHRQARPFPSPSTSTINAQQQQQSVRKLLVLSDGADESNLGECEGDCDRGKQAYLLILCALVYLSSSNDNHTSCMMCVYKRYTSVLFFRQ